MIVLAGPVFTASMASRSVQFATSQALSLVLAVLFTISAAGPAGALPGRVEMNATIPAAMNAASAKRLL
jgi:hypothetical protein